MSTHENNEDQGEVEVNLFAEEDLVEGKVDSITGEIKIDFGEAADSMLEDIKSDSLYGFEPESVTENGFDPGEVASDTVINVENPAANQARGQFTESTELEELPEDISLMDEDEETLIYDVVDEDPEEKALRSRRRLRRLLVFFIIVLLILAALIGLFIWRDSTPPDVKKPDSDALQTSSAGANSTEFQAISADSLPKLVSFFGLTPDQVAEQSNGTITLDAASAPSSDAALPAVVSTRNAWYASEGGQTLASITFGMNAEGTINYAFASFDLDAYGVADARFDELVSSDVVAASVLKGIGLSDATVKEASLTITKNPEAVIARDSAAQEVAQFSGATNIEGAPTEWKLTETYDHTTGVTIGDNSVIRTLSVDLR